MYRESLLGVALASTLSELDPSCRLSEGQKAHLWDIFDTAMDRALAEAPVLSRVRVHSPAPHTHTAGVETSAERLTFPATPSERTPPPTCDVLDEDTIFPVYRVHDGMWTIILKKPNLEIKDGVGRTETVQLDYLKVYLKDVSAKEDTKRSGKKRRR